MNKAENVSSDAWQQAAAEQLKAEVENSARTQGDIAAGAGMSVRSLRRYMSGEREITIGDLRRVLEEIGLDWAVYWRRVDQRSQDL